MFRRCLLSYSPKPLSAPAITQALQSLQGWRVDGNSVDTIARDFVFTDFIEAMTFMQRVAPECEKLAHHPMWVNVYNRVGVKLTTHDAGNVVTQNDIDLATKMNEICAEMHKDRRN